MPDWLERAILEQRERKDFGTSVFLIDTLGFVTPTAARGIGLAETLRFEAVHAESYRRFDYTVVRVAAGTVETRVAEVLAVAGA